MTPSRPWRLAGLALLGLTAVTCSTLDGLAPSPGSGRDPHSHAEPDRVRVRHVELDLTLDFEARRVRGKARLDLVRNDPEAPLVLDDGGLVVDRVLGQDGRPRAFRRTASGLGSPHVARAAGLGEALSIELAPTDGAVVVEYATAPGAEALQWLEPAQTAGGTAPFVFTQGQSILTRTWVPLQDSPGVRITYAARVRAPRGLTVLMAAEQLGQDADGAFVFRMQHPIPPYLMALACGDLAFRPVSSRAGIWAEPATVERARAEFEDTEAMVRAAEALFGAYRWGRFDVLVLPPSFPFGGMENPCLTFATPTVIAGDKSLVSLIAHELAHSWSGNLVTNATWRDFWLNEGFTVYFENRIMERVYGVERARMEMQLARAELVREMEGLEPWAEVLHVDLAHRHPDDGFSGVPYNKGALFLMRLEEVVGRERLDRFLRAWFDGHAFQSVTTAVFREFLENELLDGDRRFQAAIDVDEWLEQPGLPATTPDPRATLLTAVDEVATRWRERRSAEVVPFEGWTTQERLHFLEAVGPALDAAGMAELDGRFAVTRSGNAEVLCVWLRLAVQHGYAPADGALEAFLTSIGRRKFLTPLYTELMKTPAGQERARAIYGVARGRYHSVAQGTIDGIVGPRG